MSQMDRMAAPPVIVRGHRHDADCPTDPLVCGFARQERAVAAIVLDHEEANKQSGRRRRHGERNPDTKCIELQGSLTDINAVNR
jgi:hypothetical protein